MKIGLKYALPFAVLAYLPLQAMAAPQITFQGEITDQTCQVSVNGQTNSIVLLPTVALSDFNTLTAGGNAGLTPFTISLTGCQANNTGSAIAVKTNFLGYNVDTTEKVLGNTLTGSTAATGFGIELLTSSSGGAKINLDGVTPVAGLEIADGADSASYDFGAQYYSLGGNNQKAGKISATAEYTISYL